MATFRIAAMFVTMVAISASAVGQETLEQRYVISIERIWDRAQHNAFTDLVQHDEHLYCTFREGTGHIPGLNGTIRVLRSRDGHTWQSVALLAEQYIDLRDPKLSIAPDGRLVVNMGASTYHGTKRLKVESRVAFSTSDGSSFGPPEKVVLPEAITTGFDWLWRLTWHEGFAWGCAQQVSADRNGPRALQLVRRRDAIRYEKVATLAVDGPSETTLRFLADGTLAAMIRCESKPQIGRIGLAKPPYTEWKFNDSNKRLGGPNFVQLPGGAWLAGSREYEPSPHTALWWLDPVTGKFKELVTFPSSGDNSYPGLVVDARQNRVLVSYYSSHEGKAPIYLAALRLDVLEDAAKNAR
jgi:hypothetical protein